jgi:hypothetical protein
LVRHLEAKYIIVMWLMPLLFFGPWTPLGNIVEYRDQRPDSVAATLLVTICVSKIYV